MSGRDWSCDRVGGCVCGGDTPGVRAGCANFVSGPTPEMDVSVQYRNKKTGLHYEILTEGRNCTNAQDGQTMVVYHQIGNPGTLLFREKEEFKIKFEAM